jgi:hypothetical protein
LNDALEEAYAFFAFFDALVICTNILGFFIFRSLLHKRIGAAPNGAYNDD